MPKGAPGTISWQIDMTDINQLIGAVYATDDLGAGSNYMMDLISSSFNDVEGEFNREVTTTAIASGRFRHMFEWGTQGINRGKTNMRPNPDSEAARLWRTGMVQSRAGNVIAFTYEPSKAIVPKPTVAQTGASPAILKKLSDHVFWNKAMVIEEGIQVKVERINAQVLFIPLAYLGIRGYTMALGPTHPTPGVSRYRGETHRGTFSAFFAQFWTGRGTDMMQMRCEQFFAEDLETEIRRLETDPGKWGAPNVRTQTEQINRTIRTVRKNLERAAQIRKERT